MPTKLSRRQLAQRKYAAAMRGLRKRAAGARGGRGRVGKRTAAAKLRRKLGLGKARQRVKRAVRKTTRRAAGKKRGLFALFR